MTDKAALRASALHDLGVRQDDALEGAQHAAHQARGAVGAYGLGAKAIAKLEGHVDTDVEEGKLTLAEAKPIKLWLGRARAAIESMGKQSEGQVLMAEGRVLGLKASIELTRKAHEVELRQIPPARIVSDEVPQGDRPSDARPAGVKARRQAAAKPAKKKAAKKKAKKKAARKTG